MPAVLLLFFILRKVSKHRIFPLSQDRHFTIYSCDLNDARYCEAASVARERKLVDDRIKDQMVKDSQVVSCEFCAGAAELFLLVSSSGCVC